MNQDQKRTILKLENFLPYRLSVLSNRVSGAIAAAYELKFGISIPEWRIIAILAEYPEISADEVCQKTQIEKSIVSRAVSRLLARELITREFSQTDRRRSILSLSQQGWDVYDEVIPIAVNYEKQLLKSISEPERIQLDELLAKLVAGAREFQEKI